MHGRGALGAAVSLRCAVLCLVLHLQAPYEQTPTLSAQVVLANGSSSTARNALSLLFFVFFSARVAYERVTAK